MIRIDAAGARELLPFAPLADAIAGQFVVGCECPPRHMHEIKVPGATDATVFLMPAWQTGSYLGIKIGAIFPSNTDRGEEAVSAEYILMSAATGRVVALIDGGELTARRTAAASALAARLMARPDARRLLVVGTGRVCANLARAHAALRPGLAIEIWGRSEGKAAALAAALSKDGMHAKTSTDLEASMRAADIVSCATLAQEPLVRGRWLEPGTHVDLVGGYTPAMREADDDTIARARIACDTFVALDEAGDLSQPLAVGLIKADDIADMHQLCAGKRPGRRDASEITLFKSVGCALEDLAGGVLAYQGASEKH